MMFTSNSKGEGLIKTSHRTQADYRIIGMIEAGFVDVVEEQRLIPINSWPVNREDKLIGSWQSLNFLKLAGGLGKMLQIAGFPQEDLPKFQEQFRHDVTWAQMRVYFPSKWSKLPSKVMCRFLNSCTYIPANGRQSLLFTEESRRELSCA